MGPCRSSWRIRGGSPKAFPWGSAKANEGVILWESLETYDESVCGETRGRRCHLLAKNARSDLAVAKDPAVDQLDSQFTSTHSHSISTDDKIALNCLSIFQCDDTGFAVTRQNLAGDSNRGGLSRSRWIGR